MNYTADNISARLKELRKREGLSQMQLAVKMQTTVHSIQQWEQRIALPSLDSLMRLCTALDCEIEDIIERRSA